MKKYEPDDNNFAGDDTTKYFYTGSAVLYTTNTYGNLMTENILDPNGQIIASKRFDDDFDSGTPYELADKYVFFHYDIRGSVTNVVRPDGTLLEGYTYDEFGNKQIAKYGANGQPTSDNNFKNEVTFTGSISDMSTGLQYMNARYYNTKTGRFLSQDTYSGNVYEPMTQHLYVYCGNNPTNMVDPTGHKWVYVGMSCKYWVDDSPAPGRGHDIPKPKVPKKSGTPYSPTNKNKEDNKEKSIDSIPLNEIIKKAVAIGNEEKTGTITIAQIEFSANFLAGGTASVQLVADWHGNIGFQYTVGGGGSIGTPGIAGNLVGGGTNAKNIDTLRGFGGETGGSGYAGVGGTGARVFGLDAHTLDEVAHANETYSGAVGGVGVGTPGGEGHHYITYTEYIGEPWNIYDTPGIKDIFNSFGGQ